MPWSITAAACRVDTPSGIAHEAALGDERLLRVRALRVHGRHAVARLQTTVTPGPTALDDARDLAARRERVSGGLVEAEAEIDLDEVDADRLDADERLAGLRRRVGDLLEAERLRTAGSVDADGFHGRSLPAGRRFCERSHARLTKRRGRD